MPAVVLLIGRILLVVALFLFLFACFIFKRYIINVLSLIFCITRF